MQDVTAGIVLLRRPRRRGWRSAPSGTRSAPRRRAWASPCGGIAPTPSFFDHAFPDGGVRAGIGEVGLVERERRAGGERVARVVAGDAVLVHHLLVMPRRSPAARSASRCGFAATARLRRGLRLTLRGRRQTSAASVRRGREENLLHCRSPAAVSVAARLRGAAAPAAGPSTRAAASRRPAGWRRGRRDRVRRRRRAARACAGARLGGCLPSATSSAVKPSLFCLVEVDLGRRRARGSSRDCRRAPPDAAAWCRPALSRSGSRPASSSSANASSGLRLPGSRNGAAPSRM